MNSKLKYSYNIKKLYKRKFLVQHSHLFPRGLGEIIARHNIDELHVTLTEGLWNYKNWGYPFHDAGPGAEITAWFNKNVTK